LVFAPHLRVETIPPQSMLVLHFIGRVVDVVVDVDEPVEVVVASSVVVGAAAVVCVVAGSATVVVVGSGPWAGSVVVAVFSDPTADEYPLGPMTTSARSRAAANRTPAAIYVSSLDFMVRKGLAALRTAFIYQRRFHIKEVDYNKMAKAPVGKRILAYIIDGIMGGVAFAVLAVGGIILSMVLGVVLAAAIGSAGILAMFLWVIPYLLGLALMVGYMLFRDGLNGGRSYGKKFMGLKVVKNGAPATFMDSLLRNITLIVPLLNIVDLVLGLVDAEGKRIGDKIANTQVVEA